MKIAYVSGYWSTNIGNAFFNIGADYVLKKTFGENNVHAIFDQPAGIFRSQKHKGNPKRAISLIEHSNVDIVVLLGPVLSKDFLNVWSRTILGLKNRGIRYMLLSCGMMKCNKRDLDAIKVFFLDSPPCLVTTRDTDAFEALEGLGFRIYDGIDFAFFLPEAHEPITFDYEKIITLNFDKFFEPLIKISNSPSPNDTFYFENKYWVLKFNNIIKGIGAKTDRFSDAVVYALSLLPTKDRRTKIDDYEIIRTDHRFTPMYKNKVFRFSNSFVSDVPYSYIDIYANSNLTLSDRVHACVATLSYGKSAMFFSNTKRSKLLDRVGADLIYSKPVKLDMEILLDEKTKLLDWLKFNVEALD